MPGAEPTWWRHAVVYQVYIRSFADGDGDGLGDIRGLIDRLPHIAALGADAVWVNPWYPSPLLDGGYDVADYRDIDPRLGTLADADRLIEAAGELGIRIVADLVPNHTSWEHPWFVEALAATPGDPARGRYIFREGRGPDGEQPPNNWTSFFGGPAWTRVDDGQWYLHLFDTSQPDLDWQRQDVRDEFDDVLRFWLDRGIAGFRVDVSHSLLKAPGLPDIGPPHTQNFVDEYAGGDHPYLDRDDLHEISRGWRRVLDEYDGDRMMVAEAWVAPTRVSLYLDRAYHQAFNFPFLRDGWRGHLQNRGIRGAIERQAGVDAVPTWAWGNHDTVRPATRFGLPDPDHGAAKRWIGDGPRCWLDADLGARRARAAALLQLALPGSTYVYQGEELGLPEVLDIPDEARQDPEFFRSDLAGRDGCRVPLPWSADGPGFGFGSDAPHLPQPSWWGRHAVEVQAEDPASFLTLYRHAVALRREHGVDDEPLGWLDLGRDVVAFRRGTGLTCVVNMGTQPVALPGGDVLLASGTVVGGRLAPDDAVWLLSSSDD